MKTNELMVDDYVRIKSTKQIIKLTVIDSTYDEVSYFDGEAEGELTIKLSNIEPIELTPEILEKNGFTKGGMFGERYYLAVEDFEIYIYFASVNTQLIIEKRNGKKIINLLNVEYLHILQHALKLCGIEKTIEL